MGYINIYEAFFELIGEIDEDLPRAGKLVIKAKSEMAARIIAEERVAIIYDVNYSNVKIKDVLYWDEEYVEDHDLTNI